MAYSSTDDAGFFVLGVAHSSATVWTCQSSSVYVWKFLHQNAAVTQQLSPVAGYSLYVPSDFIRGCQLKTCILYERKEMRL